jgi:predicted  nucleic acid-binding Zn-ribbon protein
MNLIGVAHHRPFQGAAQGAAMAERTAEDLARENAYLKLRLAQVEADVTDLSAENQRLREERERLHVRRAARGPDPLGGGQ